jgi:hypothetical protein
MDKNKKIDLIVLLFYPIIGAILSHLLKINAFGSIIIFLGLPSLYLTARCPEHSKKSIIFSVISSVPMIIMIDYIAHLTGQWAFPNSILQYRLFQFVSIEAIIWAVLNLYFVVMFYEHFLHHHITKRLWHPHMKYLAAIILFLFALFVAVYNFVPGLLKIPFFYLWMGIILFLIPLTLQFFMYPRFISKFFEAAAYFFYFTLIYEITALQLGWWDFPGKQFIGWVSFSNIRFPLEELVFWILLFSMAILTHYEFFDENEK